MSFIRHLVSSKWHPTPVLLPGKSHGWRSLVGCSPWGREVSDTTERLHFDFSLSCIGEGNGNPLQYSCLENPRDGGAWWAAVYGVAQSQTWLKQLSSSSSSSERGWDGWMASLTRWTWVWVDSGSWWWSGRPDVLWFMGLQRVGHDWPTELNWRNHILQEDKYFTFITKSLHIPVSCPLPLKAQLFYIFQ